MSYPARLLMLAFFGLAACVQKHEGAQKTGIASNFINITENEDAGIKEVLAFYGGRCEYGYGATARINQADIKYFWLKVNQSQPSIV